MTEDDVQDASTTHPSDKNVFQKFYRFSRKKLARSSSFILQTEVYNPHKGPFYVSGAESLILGSKYSQQLVSESNTTARTSADTQTRSQRVPTGALRTRLVDTRTAGSAKDEVRGLEKGTNTNTNRNRNFSETRPDVTNDNALIW